MNKTKGFSYDPEKDMDVINHIEKQPHQANYILSVIRSDMSKQKEESLEAIIERCVEKLLKNKKKAKISKDIIAD